MRERPPWRGRGGCHVREGEARGNPDRHPGSPREAEGGERGWERDPGERCAPSPRARKKGSRPLTDSSPRSKKRRLPTLPLLRSTIGVTGLNFSVRDGKRWIPRAIATLISLKK